MKSFLPITCGAGGIINRVTLSIPHKSWAWPLIWPHSLCCVWTTTKKTKTMSNTKQTPIIYLAQLEGTQLAKKREILRLKLENLKELPHDKSEFKKRKKEIIAEMNALTFEMQGKYSEIFKQNFKVVQYMLMMFVGMDFVTRLYDEAADMFKAVTVGIKRDELLDFVKLCREVATRANNVVRIIDEAGKDAMSMAYAELEEGIGESMLDGLRNKVEAYGNSPAGRKYFYGEH